MIKKILSTTMAMLIAVSGLTSTAMVAQASNYAALPVYAKAAEDTLETAPKVNLGQSYTVTLTVYFPTFFLPLE